MKIKLKNIGVLSNAEIDLSKDLIILCGPNNSGKTYAAYTVYGLYRYMQELVSSDIIYYWIDIIKKKPTTNTIDLLEFYKIFEASIHTALKNDFSIFLKNVFATNNFYFEKSEVTFEKELYENEIMAFEFIYESGNEKAVKKNGTLTAFIGKEVTDNNSSYFTIEKGNLLNSVKKFLINQLFGSVYITTAERSAINIFSKELSIKRNTIVDQLLDLRDSQKKGAENLLNKLQRYPLPIRDSLEIAEDLANLQKNKSEYGFLADRIEQVLLDGKIKISAEGEVQYSPNKSKAKNLSIHLTASIVKSLSNLVFYFRHLAKKGDFIIIDEPELNLHPDNQRKIARLLGEIIGQGFKVMISTHSDYIIREINNLVMLQSGGEKSIPLMEKYGYEAQQLIKPEQIGAYLFKGNRNYTLPVTETGFEVATIDEEINLLNNASEEIFFTLFD